jgi:predicted phosphodiesterase
MQFQVLSDTHFEMRRGTDIYINKYADNLILAGDISSHWHDSLYKFLDFVSETWNHIFYIPGNHEFYCFDKNNIRDYHKIDDSYRYHIKKRYNNVYYLNNDVIWFDGVSVYYEPVLNATCIIGSTLWSAPDYGIEVEINDFYRIYVKEDQSDNSKLVQISSDDMKLENQISIQYIQDKLVINKEYYNNDAKTIVITHFPPVRGGTSSPHHVNEEEIIKSYYSNKLDNFIKENPQINWWIFGHTHYANVIDKYETRLLTNAIGYPDDRISRKNIASYQKDIKDIYSCVFET